jgi:hypothetical protein
VRYLKKKGKTAKAAAKPKKATKMSGCCGSKKTVKK